MQIGAPSGLVSHDRLARRAIPLPDVSRLFSRHRAAATTSGQPSGAVLPCGNNLSFKGRIPPADPLEWKPSTNNVASSNQRRINERGEEDKNG